MVIVEYVDCNLSMIPKAADTQTDRFAGRALRFVSGVCRKIPAGYCIAKKDGERKIKFFIYSRKSVYTGKGESIENQIEMCRRYITAKFPGAVDADMIIYEDEGFSAKNTDRPHFQKMLRDIRTQKPEFVVCYRLDRISRNVSDFSTLIEDLNAREISFVCIKEEFDTSKPMGKAMMYIASVFAQLERETIAERVRDNMLMLARTGRWLGGTTPTGYSSEKVSEIILDGKVKTACKLRDNPDELAVIDSIFSFYLETHSISAVHKRLMLQGIRSRAGSCFSLPGIKEILQNPVYCTADRAALDYFTEQRADVCFNESGCTGRYGLLAYNKRDYKKKHAPRQPVDKWIIAIGRHRGRIPGEKWVAVQRILADNIPTGKAPARQANGYSLLSGLIYCGKCGERMFSKIRSGSPAGQFDYVCSGKLHGGTSVCTCQNIGGQQADALVCKSLLEYAESGPEILPLLKKLKRDLQQPGLRQPAAVMEEQIRRCNAELSNLVHALSRGDLAQGFIEQVNTRAAKLDNERKKLLREKARLTQQTADESDSAIQLAALAGTLSSLRTCFPQLSVYEKRTFIRLVTQKIVWDGTDFHIFIGGG